MWQRHHFQLARHITLTNFSFENQAEVGCQQMMGAGTVFFLNVSVLLLLLGPCSSSCPVAAVCALARAFGQATCQPASQPACQPACHPVTKDRRSPPCIIQSYLSRACRRLMDRDTNCCCPTARRDMVVYVGSGVAAIVHETEMPSRSQAS